MRIAELFAEVGFKFDTMKLREVAKGIGDLTVDSTVSTAGTVKLGESIKDILVDVVHTSEALTTMSEATGLNPEYIQRFEKFAQIMGSTKQEADGFLNTIGQIQTALAAHEGDPTPFLMMGFNPMGMSKEELITRTNDMFKNPNWLKQWAGRVGVSTLGSSEQLAEFRRRVAHPLGITDSMMRPFSSSDMQRQLDPSTSSISVLSSEEIKNAVAAQHEFLSITQDINTELGKMVSVLLPGITEALTEFKDNGGLKTLVDSFKFIGDMFRVVGLVGGTGLTFAKAGLTEASNFYGGAMNAATRQGMIMRNEINISVHTDDPHAFTKALKPHLEDFLKKADLQFGQST